MTLGETHALDGIDRQLLNALQSDSKRSLKEIGGAVGLSAPSVMERVRKLENAGIIKGYHALLDARKVGLDIAAFIGVGLLALRLYARYFTRVISSGSFNLEDNNNLGQMIAVFAFAMLSVGLAAPGAMSHHIEINAIGIFGSVFFGTVAVVMGLLKFVIGFKAMLRDGIAPAASPSLWIIIPILTLLGIATLRITHGLSHGFEVDTPRPWLFVLLSSMLSLQLLFGLLGYTVMKRIGYFRDYLHGTERHPGSYALVCPGVALFVFGMFFVHIGLVQNGLIEPLSMAYFVALAPLVLLQVMTLATLFRLNDRLLRRPADVISPGAVAVADAGRQA